MPDCSERIAIVGVGGIFPGALDLAAFWSNIRNGIDAGRHVPSDRWFLAPEKALSADGPQPDRVYSTWGCFIEGFRFDPTGLDLDRDFLEHLDPLFHLGLHAARAAFVDAGQLAGVNLSRVSVILGNIALPTESTSAMCRDVLGRTFLEKLIDAAPLSIDRREELKSGLDRTSRPFDFHPANRFAASLPAALIAQGLGFGGSAYTLDAACASSLYALKFACDELRAHQADAVLAGGMSRPDCEYTQMGFAQLKALSRQGRCAPLSVNADGLVVGEGAGIFVLKRLCDAIASGDHIYGVIAGIGLSNDRGANLLAPHSEGQLRAMRLAYEEAGWRPGDVDLIECHATGTPVGDRVETASLHELWQDEPSRPGQCIVGGVKSNVGHLLTGAGAAGLMKVLLALKHQTLPPTANYGVSTRTNEIEANLFDETRSPFRVLAQAEPWPRRSAAVPRRATVNAFGFGGINAHVLIEEYTGISDLMPKPHDCTPVWVPGRIENSNNATSSERSLDIAVIGFAEANRKSESSTDLQQPVLTNQADPSLKSTNTWGVEESEWYCREFNSRSRSQQGSIDPISSVHLPLGEFRIPPLEMQDMLPQQQLMLKVAAAAIKDSIHGSGRDVARLTAEGDHAPNGSLSNPLELPVTLGNRTGVFVGIELDQNTTNFHFRWSIEEEAPQWAKLLGLDLSAAELSAWIEQLKNAAGPPLSANRVMGNLGGIVASRLAREFQVGGPSFTISSAENSGLRACELAANALRRGELDLALVGAVDLPCDVRSRVAAFRDNSGSKEIATADGATAFVLKRLEDAQRDGDRIHAVIRNVHAGRRNSTTPAIEKRSNAGANSGLMNLAGSVASFRELTLNEPVRHHWLNNRRDGVRRIRIPGIGVDGRNIEVELSEPPSVIDSTTSRAGHVKESDCQTSSSVSLPCHIFVIDGDTTGELLTGLEQFAGQIDPRMSVSELARQWFQQKPPNTDRRLAMTLIVKNIEEVPEIVREGFARLRIGSTLGSSDRRVRFSPQPLGHSGRLAFVFPGSGNAFAGMGRELLATFPDVLRRQHAENERLRDQYRPDLIWLADSTTTLLEDHKAMIFGQVSLGTAVCDLLSLFGVRPTASIGYSLGESAALFGLRAWTDRDEMLHRMDKATLFGSDLVRPFNAARREWNVPNEIAVDWISGVIDRSATDVRAVMSGSRGPNDQGGQSRVYLLIINTPTQCVIGGQRDNVAKLVSQLAASFTPFSAPSTVHCEILRQVEPAYRALHLMRTTPPLHGPKIDFYSSVWGHAYEVTQKSAADAIVAQALNTVDFPQVIERAYADGVRLFVEIGPGASCTRMIDEILGIRPHLAQAATPATAEPVYTFVELLSTLIAERIPVDLSYLYQHSTDATKSSTAKLLHREIVTQTGGQPFEIPSPPGGWRFRPQANITEQTRPTTDIVESDSAVRETSPVRCVVRTTVFSPLFGECKTHPERFLSSESARREPRPPGIETASTNFFSASVQTQNIQRASFDLQGANVMTMTQLEQMLDARVKAHETYLRVSAEAQRLMAEQLELLANPALLEGHSDLGSSMTVAQDQLQTVISTSVHSAPPLPPPPPLPEPEMIPVAIPPRSLSRPQCMEFAIGQIGRVLGSMFSEIDQHPTRVRLPDEPLMLVDRILEIDGEPLSMTSGRVVTEHDIHDGAWYLDGNRIPTCIAVEAGQADLFLSAWLGIDLQTHGYASYRLLDAVVTFHRELPQPGKTIHYNIRINNFFRQGQTYLFRFEFDATVDGERLLTMREGCAGFFTEAELASGKGIVHTALDRKPQPGKRPADWADLVPMAVESYDDSKLLALRQGRLDACFGPTFAGLPLANPMTLPGLVSIDSLTQVNEQKAGDSHGTSVASRSQLWLVDRILKLDPTGGKFGMGTILGELDIHPDDWFLTCHFCDDQVMPGTLMYECCLHTLRIYLLRMGWIGETGQVVYEPIPEVRSRLKCRGQVRANTKKVWYEITVKEIGYSGSGVADSNPTAIGSSTPTLTSKGYSYCIADALMYADGKPIVEITDMSVRLSGLSRETVERLWKSRATMRLESPPSISSVVSAQAKPHSSVTMKPARYDRRPALFDTDRITAFAIGNPSVAFGDRYRVFDSERIIARLPGPPFQFLDRIVEISGCEQWVLQAGGQVVAQYDIPVDAWYFQANRQRRMPFAVLLETALQPCGWLAGYVGSALTSDTDLSFRNLGGTATQFLDVTPESGTLTTTVKMTSVSNSGGMIIQHYEFDLRCNGEPVYVGKTYFGFFSRASLANQIGIRDAKPFVPSSMEFSQATSFAYLDARPFANADFQMIDNVQLSLNQGPFGLGFVIGTTTVDPTAWFFKAHFHQDPVVPGSLGLESFFQLLKIYAVHRWQLDENTEFSTPIVHPKSSEISPKHEWVYRGQVIPRDQLVTVTAVIKYVNDTNRELVAEGFLSVDGRVIYQMKEFSLGV